MSVTSDQQILLKMVIAYVDSRQLKVWVCVGMFQNLSGPVPAPSPHSPAPPTIRPGSAPPSRRRDVWKGSSSPPSGSPNLQDRNRQMEESWTEKVRGKKSVNITGFLPSPKRCRMRRVSACFRSNSTSLTASSVCASCFWGVRRPPLSNKDRSSPFSTRANS